MVYYFFTYRVSTAKAFHNTPQQQISIIIAKVIRLKMIKLRSVLTRIMWKLVVFTVYILSSKTRACYKPIQIENKLNSRESFAYNSGITKTSSYI